MQSLAIEVRQRKIAVGLIHPGYVKTDMTEGRGHLEKPESAEGIIKLFNELTLETSGGFWHVDGTRLPW